MRGRYGLSGFPGIDGRWLKGWNVGHRDETTDDGPAFKGGKAGEGTRKRREDILCGQ